MKIAIIQFPGSNCERETAMAVKRAGMEPISFLWNEKPDKLREMDGYIIVGGFSYEDRSRAGIIAALDPLMLSVKAESEKGKPVLGICNGAQILVETGLVPGLENNKVAMALTENKRIANNKILGTGYYNAWVTMRLSDEYQRNAFTRHLTAKAIVNVPIAHGEGRFVMTDALLQEVKIQGLNVFQYCDASGRIVDEFPINPNGSVDNIAAISNKAGNVMAMMPHPERTVMGDPIFQSMRDYIREGQHVSVAPLMYYPRRLVATSYQCDSQYEEAIVELIITDNQALTVENTLRQLGIPVKVRRRMHWEIKANTKETVEKVLASGVLYNSRKERKLASHEVKSAATINFLVRAKEDLIGQQKMQTLQDHFAINNAISIHHGNLWSFEADDPTMNELEERILQTNIIVNPYAYDCYRYHAG